MSKTFTEEEHLAILADRLGVETANLEAARAELATSVESLTAELASVKEVKDAEIASLQAEVASLKAKIEESEREAATAKLGAERVEEARALFKGDAPEAYFTAERATTYGALDETSWNAVKEALGAAPAPKEGEKAREVAKSGGQLGDKTGGEGTFVPRPEMFGGAE